MKIKYIIYTTIILLFMVFVWQAKAQRTVQGMMVNFDFGLLQAPVILNVEPNNLRCKIIQRFKYQCYDVNTPSRIIDFDTSPNRNTNENPT